MIGAPANVATDAGCDPLGAVNVCEAENEECYAADAESPATCQQATAPTLTEAELFLGTLNGNAGLTLTLAGEDPEEDITLVEIVVRDADGNDLFADNSVPALPLDTVTFARNGRAYTASITAVFPNGFAAGQVADITATVIDRAGLRSETRVASSTAPSAIEVGESCSLARLDRNCGNTGICQETTPAMDDTPAEYTCVAAVQACSDDWGVTSLNENAVEGGWSFEGDTTGADNVAEGTCGGGSPNNIFSLVSAGGGYYACEIDAGGEDTVMYARSFCGDESPGAELACNDDADAGDLGFQSRVQFYLAPGAEAFIFVDGFGGVEYAYTLTCSLDNGAAGQ
jgi:hypothetical protein